MDSSTLDVVYIPRESWELGWDALVAIGTMLLAWATFRTIKQTRTLEQSRLEARQKELRHQAGYMSVVFDHELNMIVGLSSQVLRDAWVHRRGDPRVAFQAALFATDRIQIPLMLKFASRVNRFDSLTATVVLVVVSRVMQAKLNRPPFEADDVPPEKAINLSRGAVKQLTRLRHEAKVARRMLRQYRPASVTIRESSSRIVESI